MNKLSIIQKMGGTLLSVVLTVVLIGSAAFVYRLDIKNIMEKVREVDQRSRTIEIQNINTVEARKSETLKDFATLMAQKAKIESIQKNITDHQNKVDDRQRAILELIAKIQTNQLKDVHDKQKEILTLLKTLEERQLKGTYNISRQILEDIKELKEAHKRIEERLK